MSGLVQLETNCQAPPEAVASSVEGTSRKRKQSGVKDDEPGASCPATLHEFCRQLLRRDVESGDVVYKTREVDAGCQVAELSLPTLPPPWSSRSWTSGACSSKRLARLHAAKAALRSLAMDPEVASSVAVEFPSTLEASGSSCSRSASDVTDTDGTAVGRDPKTDVVIFCQRRCGHSMRAGDITYTVVREGSQFIATVTLKCFAGETFTGDLRADRKAAEQAAAEKVLQAFAKERASLGQRAPKRRKVLSNGAGEEIAPDVRNQLHEVCRRILGRAPQAGDIVYDIVVESALPSATLRLPCLQGELGSQVWVSPPCASKSEARLWVASMALRSMSESSQCQRWTEVLPKSAL